MKNSNYNNYDEIASEKRDDSIPVSQKFTLTIKECAAYYGIGENRLRRMAAQPKCQWVLIVGPHKFLIKREQFEAFLNDQYAI